MAGTELFAALRAAFGRDVQNLQADSARNLLTFAPSRFHDIGHVLFSNLQRGGFCTFVVGGSSDWDPTSHYYESARNAARRGMSIQRAFLLPMRSAVHNRALREQIRLDDAAGVQTRVLFVGDLVSKAVIPPAQSLEFGMWDDEVVCVLVSVDLTSTGPKSAEWRVSSRPEDYQSFAALRDLLLSRATDLRPLMDGLEEDASLEEPMLVTAPLARQLAPILCKGSYMARDDCSWYHSSWQYLRIFDMVSTPSWHTDFYLQTIGRFASGGDHPRVLISGTADYSMLAHVLKAYAGSGQSPKVTVVDVCDTPLLLCKWYGKYVGTDISTVNSDILTFVPVDPFDMIVSDAFLTRFSISDRERVIAKWKSLLRAGGKVVTTTRVETRSTDDAVSSTDDEITNFARRALREADKWRDFLDIAPADMAALAQRYAERMKSFSLRSEREVRELLESHGFTISTDVASVPGEMHSSKYVRIFATRDSS